MKIFVFAVMVFFPNYYLQTNKIYEARYLQSPPVFPFGTDSCQRFYFTHFKGIDSVLYKTGANGDTAKYIRVCFSFVVDKYGSAYDAHFEKMASTQYEKSVTARTLKYFSATEYYQRLIKNMMDKMPLWKPALLNGRAVDCRINEYLQFWVGTRPPNN
jgi:hypothetical protein